MASDPNQLLAALLGTGGITGPSFTQGQQNAQQAALAPGQLQGQQINNQIGQQQVDDHQAAQAENARYQADLANYVANPTPQSMSNMMAMHPAKYQALKQSWDVKKDDQHQSDLGFWGGVNGTLGSGDNNGAAQLIHQRLTAERAMGISNPAEQEMADKIDAGDPNAIKSVRAYALAQIAAATGPDKFADTFKTVQGNYDLTAGQSRYDGNNQLLATGPTADKPEKPEYQYDQALHQWTMKPFSGGGSPVGGGISDGSGGSAAGRDTSRLINSDAGGGYVPDSVKTLGQFVSYGKAMNAKGAKSSSAGTYQINGSTMAEFAPKVLGADWKQQPFDSNAQEKVGEAIFDWAKTQSNPAAALRGRWVSLSPTAAAAAVNGSWQQARGVIAQGETGGAPGSSANAVPGSGSGKSVGGGPFNGYPATVPVGAPDAPASAIVEGDISTVPAPIRATVQAIADGRAAAPRPGTRNGEALLDAVTAYDHTFDAANATSRVKTRVDFTSGKSAQAVNSLNTSMGHLFHLDDQVDKLGNAGFLSGLINAPRRAVQTGVMNSTAYTTFDQTKTAAASEMRKVFSNTNGGTLPELQAWESSIDSANSPDQLHAAIRNGVILMSSRLDALKDQYTNGMGRSDKMPQFIKPMIVDAAKHRFGIDLGSGQSSPPPGNQPAAPRGANGFRILGVRPK